MADKITEQDLVIMRYLFGNSVDVIDFEEAKRVYPNLKVDLEHRLWSDWGTTRGIGAEGGRRVRTIEQKDNIIGIYDRRSTEQLNQMFKDAEAVRRYFSYGI